MLSIAGIFIALEIYLGYLRFQEWIIHKAKLLKIGLNLLKAKDKRIKALGWSTIKLVFWETKDPEKS